MIGVSFADCQGWFHEAPGRRGILLVGANGFEDLATRRSWRTLADRLVEAGMPVLRYDLPGTANSRGEARDADSLVRWRKSIAIAAAWLRDHAGVAQIVVIGLRLGSLLALAEAANIPSLAGLGLLAPVSSGRRYVREISSLGRLLGTAPTSSPPSALGSAAGLEICGFHLSADICSSLGELSVDTMTPPQRTPILLLSQKGCNTTDLKRALADAQCPITERIFSGYHDMICDPTASKVPHGDLEAVATWAAGLGPIGERGFAPLCETPLDDAHSVEQGVTFGDSNQLAGILTLPRHARRASIPVIFANAGMNYNIGWARSTVRFSRALAAEGVPSLRFDAAGIGDSASGADNDGLPLYTRAFEESLSAAIDWLGERGYPQVAVVGPCSGAYGALNVLRRDARIVAAAIINLQCFHWTPAIGYEISRWQALRRTQVAADRSQAESEPGETTDHISGLRGAGTAIVRLAARAAKRVARSSLFANFIQRSDDVVSGFESISARGAHVRLIYSQGDIGMAELIRVAGANAQRVAGLSGLSIHVVEDADHNFTQQAAQTALLDLLLPLTNDPAHHPAARRPAA